MRDLFAALVALALLVVAASLGNDADDVRRRRLRARDSERALDDTVLAEIPADDDLRLFSEDAVRFYYGDAQPNKDLIIAVPGADQRVADCGLRVEPLSGRRRAAGDELGGSAGRIARDRWDVAIEIYG